MLERGPARAVGLEDLERLLEEGDRLPVRRARGRLGPGLAQVVHRPLAQAAAQGVVGQPLDVLAQAPGVEPLDGVHDARVQRAPRARGAGCRRPPRGSGRA